MKKFKSIVSKVLLVVLISSILLSNNIYGQVLEAADYDYINDNYTDFDNEIISEENELISEYNEQEIEVNSFENQEDDDLVYSMNVIEPDLIEQLHYGENGVHPGTGNFSRTYVDMTVPSSSLNMDVVRVYNSRNNYNNDFGSGWYLGYQGDIRIEKDQYLVTLPNSSLVIFYKTNDGAFHGETTRHKLMEIKDGYILITKDQIIYEFNKVILGRGTLRSIKDRHGNITTISYGINNRISEVIDQTGRGIEVIYGDNTNRIEKIKDIDGNREVNYKYKIINGEYQLSEVVDKNERIIYTYRYSNSLLSAVLYGAGNNIETVDYYSNNNVNAGKVLNHRIYITGEKYNQYKYEYDTNNRLTTITDSDKRVVKKCYDKYMYITLTEDPERRQSSAEYYLSTRGFDWNVKKSDSLGRHEAAYAEDNGKIYSISGMGYRYINNWWTNEYAYATSRVYNVKNDFWDTISDLKDHRVRASACVLKGKIYVAGGTKLTLKENNTVTEQTSLNDVWVFDGKVWTQAPSLNYIVSSMCLVELNDEIYAISAGGKIVEKFNGLSWTRISDSLENSSSRGRSFAAVINNKIYKRNRDNKLEAYDPMKEGTNEYPWSIYDTNVPEGDLVVLKNELHTVNVLTGRIYVYDFDMKKWEYVSTAIVPEDTTGLLTFCGRAISSNDKIYIFFLKYPDSGMVKDIFML